MNNIHFHVDNLIRTIPIPKNPHRIDLVLEGGLFNGSYLIGALYYLKGLERHNIIKIDRLSGCSIGSLVSLIYYTNTFKLSDIIYKITYKHFKKTCNVNIFDKIFDYLRPYITENILKKLNNNLYITYYNIKTNTQIVKNTYKNVEELFDTIKKSCFCPYVVDNSFVYKKKYVDGFYPYIFPPAPSNKKILYLNIHNFDILINCISIKNEKTNYTRIYAGILDIHSFYQFGTHTSMCSYVNDWTCVEYLKHSIFVRFVKIFPYLLHKIYMLNNVIIKNGIEMTSSFYKKIINSIYIYFIKKYCV